jgi:hypothetical protein
MTLIASGIQRKRVERVNERLTGLDDLSRHDRDVQHPLVQVLNQELSPSNSRQQVHLCLAEQIIPFPLESRVLLLLQHNHHISRLDPRTLVALAREPNLLPRLHPLVDVHLEHLALAVDLLAVTRLAPVFGVHHLPAALAFVTRLLDLLDHRTDLTEHHLDTLPAARCTGGDGALFAAAAFAGLADDRFGEGELLNLALVKVFQADGDSVDQVFAFLRSSAPS